MPLGLWDTSLISSLHVMNAELGINLTCQKIFGLRVRHTDCWAKQESEMGL